MFTFEFMPILHICWSLPSGLSVISSFLYFENFSLNPMGVWDNECPKASVTLAVWSSGKSYLFLQNFEKVLLENLICSHGIFSPEKSDVFLHNLPGKCPYGIFFLLENRISSCEILRLLWKVYMCYCIVFGSSYYIQASWKIWKNHSWKKEQIF